MRTYVPNTNFSNLFSVFPNLRILKVNNFFLFNQLLLTLQTDEINLDELSIGSADYNLYDGNSKNNLLPRSHLKIGDIEIYSEE